MNVVELDRVGKVFSGRPSLGNLLRFVAGRDEEGLRALADVSLSIAAGETVGLVGRNGSGKSTLGKIVAGLLLPTSGEIRVRGRVAGLFDLGAGFDPHSTGRANVELAATLMGLDRREIASRLPGILAFADLGDAIDRPVREYSAGMFLRLAFSVAASVEADLLVIDEVLAVGDLGFRKRCTERLESFRSAGGALLVVSHEPGVLDGWCSRLVWLEAGRIHREGPTGEVLGGYVLDSARRTAPAELAALSTGAVSLEAIEVRGPRGDGSLELVATLTVRAATSVVVEAVVTRADWTGCCATRTAGPPGDVPSATGRWTVRLTLDPLRLLDGRYLVSLRVSGRDGTDLLAVPAAGTFVVGTGGGEVGVFRPDHRWDLSGAAPR